MNACCEIREVTHGHVQLASFLQGRRDDAACSRYLCPRNCLLRLLRTTRVQFHGDPRGEHLGLVALTTHKNVLRHCGLLRLPNLHLVRSKTRRQDGINRATRSQWFRWQSAAIAARLVRRPHADRRERVAPGRTAFFRSGAQAIERPRCNERTLLRGGHTFLQRPSRRARW